VTLEHVAGGDRALYRHGSGVALVLLLALVSCSKDDGATGVPNSALEDDDIVITVIDPDTATVDTTITVRIAGSGFTEGSSATWVIDTTAATAIRTISTTWKSPTELEAVIAISPNAELRPYSVRIRGKKGKQGIAVERFRVVAKPALLPEPGTRSEASDINDSGVIVGWSDDAAREQIAIKWSPVDSAWTYSILGKGIAVAINEEGVILRRKFDALARFYHSWIHLPSGGELDFGPVLVAGISNDGTIIGAVIDSTQKRTPVVWRQVSPASWGPPQALPIPAGFTGAWLDVISDAGHIAGAISSSDSTVNVVWRYRDGQWLMPEPVDRQVPAGASAINDAGALAGWFRPCIPGLPNCYVTAAYWASPGGVRKSLPTLYNTQAFVSGMSNSNQVVGSALVHYSDGVNSGPYAALIQHAVIWFPGSQWPEDLGAIRPSHPGEALAINNRGWVVGFTYGDDFFKPHAVVWKLPGSSVIAAPIPASRR